MGGEVLREPVYNREIILQADDLIREMTLTLFQGDEQEHPALYLSKKHKAREHACGASKQNWCIRLSCTKTLSLFKSFYNRYRLLST